MRKELYSLYCNEKIIYFDFNGITTLKSMILKKQNNNAYPTGSQKWEASTCVPFQYLSTLYLDYLKICHIENRTIIGPKRNNKIPQFQVGYL